MEFSSYIGILTNSGIITYTSELFDPNGPINPLSVFIIIVLASFILNFLVAAVFGGTDKSN